MSGIGEKFAASCGIDTILQSTGLLLAFPAVSRVFQESASKDESRTDPFSRLVCQANMPPQSHPDG
jgi:hypothetical protein